MPLSSSRSKSSLSVQNLSYIEPTKCSIVNSFSQNNNCLSFITTPDLTDLNSAENNLNSKRHREKANILREILFSERKYLNDLKEIVEGYYEEIYKLHPSNEEFVYHIFSNIKEIYEFTKCFYSMLELAGTDEIAIASCFIKKHKTFSKLYSTYCQNYKIAFSTTERLEKDHVIGKIIQRVRTRYGHCLKMATYLQLPVLRITKYHLLLQRYLKLLEKDSLAYDQILEALELMKQVNDQINKDMPDMMSNGEMNSNTNIQKFISLFGSILRQGNLILTETKKIHYVFVFQTMFMIRKSDCSSEIMHTISNENLAFLPKSSTENKSCNKYFTIIDYSQSKGENVCQFTFKAKSMDDKHSWQSSILSCMLNGYGKKISENVKTKMMKMENEKNWTIDRLKSETLRKKLPSFKRLKDFRYSIKNEFKKATTTHDLTQEFKEEKQLDKSNESINDRRLSDPIHSRLVKILEWEKHLKKSIDKSDKIENLLKVFRKEKLQKLNVIDNKELKDFQVQCTLIDDSLEKMTINNTSLDDSYNNSKEDIKNESAIEIRLNNFEIIYEHLNTSYDEISSQLDETTLLKFEKFINKNIAMSSKSNRLDNSVSNLSLFETFNHSSNLNRPSSDSNKFLSNHNIENFVQQNQVPAVINNLNPEVFDIYESSSSKSSINSEEGYYSNHDSSESTLMNEKQEIKIKNNEINHVPFSLKISNRTFSTPELTKPNDYPSLYTSFEEEYQTASSHYYNVNNNNNNENNISIDNAEYLNYENINNSSILNYEEISSAAVADDEKLTTVPTMKRPESARNLFLFKTTKPCQTKMESFKRKQKTNTKLPRLEDLNAKLNNSIETSSTITPTLLKQQNISFCDNDYFDTNDFVKSSSLFVNLKTPVNFSKFSRNLNSSLEDEDDLVNSQMNFEFSPCDLLIKNPDEINDDLQEEQSATTNKIAQELSFNESSSIANNTNYNNNKNSTNYNIDINSNGKKIETKKTNLKLKTCSLSSLKNDYNLINKKNSSYLNTSNNSSTTTNHNNMSSFNSTNYKNNCSNNNNSSQNNSHFIDNNNSFNKPNEEKIYYDLSDFKINVKDLISKFENK